ncbi:alpha/beta fold hydrolase [Candidatus Nitrosocosmicus arcticus]|uniref:alpha/beta fold hydrolase n=1 Tax=Candidatus Nitrosocosmicus arcticus TaxID=2035267 RepID=UPI0011A1C313|nr:alpha/beta fold hydrolase [Candidatus Nitrosocosmicus arcticus]
MYNKIIANYVNSMIDIYALQISYFNLYSEYSSVYLNVLLDESKKGIDKSLYERWISQIDIKLDEELRTDNFISTLSNFLLSLSRVIKDSKYYGLDKLIEEVISFNLTKYILDNSIFIPNRYDNKQNVTSYKIVGKINNIELINFIDEDRKTNNNTKPVLLVYAQINRFNIMDLTPEKSVVKNLMSHGLDVYLLKWDDLAYYNSNSTIEDYIELINEAIKLISSKTSIDKIPIIGYCWGGTLSLIFSSLFPKDVLSLTLVASPIDFSKDNSLLSLWSKSLEFDKIINELGHMKGTLLDIAFILRNPPRHLFDKYYKLSQKGDDPKFVELFFAVEKWLNNTPDIPGPFHKKFINSLYKENCLVKGNLILFNNDLVNLEKINFPVMTVTAVNDELVSFESTEAVLDHVKGSVKQIQIPGGHVGLCIGRKAHDKVWPEVANWIKINYDNSNLTTNIKSSHLNQEIDRSILL